MDPLPAAEFTTWFLVFLTMTVVCFDVFIGYRHGADVTVSRQLLLLGSRYPILAFGFGVLLGHIFWPQRF